MEKVLVTGGAGFIGSHVVEHLLAVGRFVYVLDNFRTGQEENIARFKGSQLEVIRDSVTNVAAHEQLQNVTTVFHLAAEVGNINSIEHPVADAEANISGTIHICEFARRTGAKVIYSSSSAIYGESAYLPIDEDHPLRPKSPYGLSKLTGELYVRLYGEIHNVPYVCLRYFNAYGEGQLFNPYSNVIPIFVRRLMKSEPLCIYGDGEQTRDFVHVKDIARANLLAAESPTTDGVFNVASGVRSSINALVEILRQLHPGLRVEFQPPRVGEVRDSVAKIDAFARKTGFSPGVRLMEGVAQYYNWMRSAGLSLAEP